MEGSDSVKRQTTADRGSAASTNDLIIDNSNNDILSNERQTPKSKRKNNLKTLKKRSELSSRQTTADEPTISGAFGLPRAATVFWYLCIGILFLIAFIALIISIIYFVSDTTTDEVIKLYGICGGGVLALITFLIIFLDCFNDGNRKEHEELVTYRILQAKKAKQKALFMRRSQRTAESKGERPKPFIIQHQGIQIASNNSNPQPHHHHHHHHSRYGHHHSPHHTHYIPAHSSTHHHRSIVYPTSHDLHSTRHNLINVGVNTLDKFVPISKSKAPIRLSTHDTQTNPELWDIERGTQTARTEGTQTSTKELNGIPSNVTEIIHEKTILKAPRELLGTLKESMAQQERDMTIGPDVTDANELIAFM